MEVQRAHSAVIIGGGPAGLTAALELARRQVPTTVLEKGAIVGGLARTESHRGFRFDLGGHRFFTKVPQVEAWWRELLGAEFLRRPRLSRIFYDGKYVAYPLKPWNALGALGVGQAVLVVASYLRWPLRPSAMHRDRRRSDMRAPSERLPRRLSRQSSPLRPAQ